MIIRNDEGGSGGFLPAFGAVTVVVAIGVTEILFRRKEKKEIVKC